jgi:hypothetical protein
LHNLNAWEWSADRYAADADSKPLAVGSAVPRLIHEIVKALIQPPESASIFLLRMIYLL